MAHKHNRAITEWTVYQENLKPVIEQGADMRQRPHRKLAPTHRRTANPR